MGHSLWPGPAVSVWSPSWNEIARRRLRRGAGIVGSSPPEKSTGWIPSGLYQLVVGIAAELGTRGALQALVGLCHPARLGTLDLEAFAALPDGRPSTAGGRRFPTASGELGNAVEGGQGGYTPSITASLLVLQIGPGL